jgi:hypothetical protein
MWPFGPQFTRNPAFPNSTAFTEIRSSRLPNRPSCHWRYPTARLPYAASPHRSKTIERLKSREEQRLPALRQARYIIRPSEGCRSMNRRFCVCSFLPLLVVPFASAQVTKSKMIFKSREYRAVGHTYPQTWLMTLPDQQKVNARSERCRPQRIASAVLPADARLPDRSEHWNYLTSVSASPDGRLLLVGSQAGSSTSSYEDYWLFDRASKTWRYAGGGNKAKWSPDSSTIVWSTPRELAPIGRIHVWVVHLMLLDVRTLKQTPLTSGVTYESDFFWCSLS